MESLDILDKNGNTPLMLAAAKGNINDVVRLLELGATPSIDDGHGMTARNRAKNLGHREIVSILDKATAQNKNSAILHTSQEKSTEPEYFNFEPSISTIDGLMEHGKVKWFSQEKGYGFITSDSGEDHHFSVRGINGAELPSNGDGVSFESKAGNKGKRALNVSITFKNLQKSRYTDDRISCPACDKKIVPRIITDRGQPEKSVCPYCAETVMRFSNNDCFIATAVYGDPCCVEVRALRAFRDEQLLKNYFGSIFVKIYYKLSPPIADWLIGKERISKKIRILLNYLVKLIQVN